MTVSQQVEVRLLGPPRVLRDGELVGFDTRKATEFFDRHGNHSALRRGEEGVRDYVRELLPRM